MTPAAAAPAAESGDALRSALLMVAGRILASEGERALTMRRVASEAGCSTMMLYTLFGGKDQLIGHVHDDGFAQLAATLVEDAPAREPLERIRQLGRAYRRFAHAQPTLYLAVFARRPAPSVSPVYARRRASPSFTPLVSAVHVAMDAGVFDRSASAEEHAEALWAVVHGHVSLELTGYFDAAEPRASERFDRLVRAAVDGLARRADTPARAPMRARTPSPRRR